MTCRWITTSLFEHRNPQPMSHRLFIEPRAWGIVCRCLRVVVQTFFFLFLDYTLPTFAHVLISHHRYVPKKIAGCSEESGLPINSASRLLFVSVQPCTEVLFLDIFHNYSQTLTPVLLDMVQNLQGQFNVTLNIFTCLKSTFICLFSRPFNVRLIDAGQRQLIVGSHSKVGGI